MSASFIELKIDQGWVWLNIDHIATASEVWLAGKDSEAIPATTVTFRDGREKTYHISYVEFSELLQKKAITGRQVFERANEIQEEADEPWRESLRDDIP